MEEVLLSDDDCQQQDRFLPYDPSQNLDDIFSGLTEEDFSGDGVGDSSQTLPYEDFSISPTQKEEFTRGLQGFASLERVLEDFSEVGTVLPFTEDSSMGGLLGLSDEAPRPRPQRARGSLAGRAGAALQRFGLSEI